MYLELEDFLYDCESRKMSVKTLKSYRNNIKLFLKYLEGELNITNIKDIKTIHVKKYIQSKDDRKETYVNSIIKTLRTYFVYCVEEEFIIKNPMEKIKLVKEDSKVIETFTDKEVNLMINYFDYSDYLNVRNKSIIALQVDTGIRTTETIDIENSFIENDRVFIMGKGKKQRYVYLSTEMKKILQRYERTKKLYFVGKEIPDNYFLSRTGRPLTVEAIERIYKVAGVGVDVRSNIRCSPHTARHYFAFKMLEHNDIYTVSKLMGHSRVSTTQIYLTSLNDKRLIEDRKIINPLSKIR